MSLPLHGSHPVSLYKSFNIDIVDNYIDFSVNVNPLGTLPMINEHWPHWLNQIADYPEPFAETLVEQIALKEHIGKENILIGNGAAQLIALLANYFHDKRVAIIHPTFSEYEKMCRMANCQLVHVVLRENEWEDLSPLYDVVRQVDVIFLCHPNNPTGVTYERGVMQKIIETCRKNNCYLIIDEAFYDFTNEQISYAFAVMNYPNVIVLRSLTKMYAIAGLRLGYVVAPEELIFQLKESQPYWSVNTIAQKAGELCVNDRQFTMQTREFISYENERVRKTLIASGYNVSNSKVNFYLLRDPNLHSQKPFITFLLKNGIVPRHTENFRGLDGRWIRLAIKTKAENDRLLDALLHWREINSCSLS